VLGHGLPCHTRAHAPNQAKPVRDRCAHDLRTRMQFRLGGPWIAIFCFDFMFYFLGFYDSLLTRSNRICNSVAIATDWLLQQTDCAKSAGLLPTGETRAINRAPLSSLWYRAIQKQQLRFFLLPCLPLISHQYTYFVFFLFDLMEEFIASDLFFVF